MKEISLIRPIAVAAMIAALVFAGGPVFAQSSLAPNQTLGLGNNKLLTFTYGQNFDCVDQPTDDLDFNGILMQSDPGEFQMPICQVATEPTIDPTGGAIKKTAHLYVLLPMFSVNNDQTASDALACPPGARSSTVCGSALGTFLITAFGAAPRPSKPLQRCSPSALRMALLLAPAPPIPIRLTSRRRSPRWAKSRRRQRRTFSCLCRITRT